MTNNYIDLKDYRLFFVEKVGELKKYQVAPLNDVDNKDKWKEVIVPISLISRYLKKKNLANEKLILEFIQGKGQSYKKSMLNRSQIPIFMRGRNES